jgi:hypothetical protein
MTFSELLEEVIFWETKKKGALNPQRNLDGNQDRSLKGNAQIFLDRSSAPLRDKKNLSYDPYPVNTIIGKLRRVLGGCKFSTLLFTITCIKTQNNAFTGEPHITL